MSLVIFTEPGFFSWGSFTNFEWVQVRLAGLSFLAGTISVWPFGKLEADEVSDIGDRPR